MTERLWAQVPTPGAGSPPSGPSRRPRAGGAEGAPSTRRDWLREPKSAIWLVLGAIFVIGGGRRVLWAWRARNAVARLAEADVSPAEIEGVAAFGRSGVYELLRIFSTTESDPQREAAGHALARLWKRDELVAEEEKALVRRGYTVDWNARRRYPRSLTAPIPIVVAYDVPFLPDDEASVRGTDLEWSHRILGARRAALEEFSPWKAGPGEVAFSIVPDDFPTNGPHRLVLQMKVRTAGLSDSWEFELPQVPFSFDFDPILRLDAILNLPDAARDESMAGAIRLESASSDDDEPARLVPLGGEWVLRHPPRLAVETPLPADLAHRVSIEFEGASGPFPAGSLIVSGQGTSPRGAPSDSPATRRFEIGPITALPEGVIERPGPRRLRVHLAADPQLGWADPRIRSVWPGQLESNWVEAEIIRR